MGTLGGSGRKSFGVYLEELNKELSEFFGVEDGQGLLVSRIEKDSPAEKAGLKVGDVIVKADGQPVDKISDMSEMIQKKEKGDQLEIEFLRNKKKMTVKVEIDEEKRERGLFFEFSRSGDNYVDALGDFYENFEKSYKNWRKEHEDEVEKNMKKLNEEMKKLSWVRIGVGKPLEMDTSHENCWPVREAADHDLICVQSRDGKHALGLAWADAGQFMARSSIPCLHSEPNYPSLKPGETLQATGKLYFSEGDLASIRQRFLGDVEDGTVRVQVMA